MLVTAGALALTTPYKSGYRHNVIITVGIMLVAAGALALTTPYKSGYGHNVIITVGIDVGDGGCADAYHTLQKRL